MGKGGGIRTRTVTLSTIYPETDVEFVLQRAFYTTGRALRKVGILQNRSKKSSLGLRSSLAGCGGLGGCVMETMRIYPLTTLPSSMLRRLYAAQQKAARIWTLCRNPHLAARQGLGTE
jgi:hypothetical protein